MRNVFFLPILFLTAFCMLFTACSESASDLSDDPAPDDAALPNTTGDSPSAPASASASSGPSRLVNFPPTGPLSIFDLGVIPKVEDLPKDYQYTAEQWQEMEEKFKLAPAVEIDYKNAEFLSCTNCSLIVDGVIFESPFYFQKTSSEVFINGYRVSPSKRIYDYMQTAEYKRIRSISADDIHKQTKALALKLPPCPKGRSFIVETIRTTEMGNDPEEFKKAILAKLSKKNIQVLEYKLHDKTNYSISFSSPGCPHDGVYVNYSAALMINNGSSGKPFPDEATHDYQELKSLIRDNTLSYISFDGGSSIFTSDYSLLVNVKKVLSLDIDLNVKLYLIKSLTKYFKEYCIKIVINRNSI